MLRDDDQSVLGGILSTEELLALPEDGLRHELLDGVHVMTQAPRPAHQLLLSENPAHETTNAWHICRIAHAAVAAM